MKKPRKKPEVVMAEELERLIKNLLIENPNYINGHYINDGSGVSSFYRFKDDTIERGSYILERMKTLTEFLRDDEEPEEIVLTVEDFK